MVKVMFRNKDGKTKSVMVSGICKDTEVDCPHGLINPNLERNSLHILCTREECVKNDCN